MRYLLIFAIVSVLFACKKEEVPTFSDKNGVAFYTLTGESDSIVYSFALNTIPKTRDTIKLKMRVVGFLANNDRTIKVIAGPGSTAKAGVDYILPEVKVPAGKLMIDYPVIVLKTAEMATTTLHLKLDVVETNDFVLGATGLEPITNSTNRLRIKLAINDRIEIPAYWGAGSNTLSIFGAFSVAKFKFMVQNTGMSDFNYATLDADDRVNLPVRLKNALIKYEATNSPLMDENNVRVTFP